MLHDFIAHNRDEIIRRCRVKVASRSVPPPSVEELDGGVPLFLNQLQDALRFGSKATSDIHASAGRHGHALLLQGFTVSQVVHDYGDVCQSITELADETGAPISVADFQTLNRSLDDAIAAAVTQYGKGKDQAADDRGSDDDNRQLHFLVHELRNLVNTALLAFDVLETGNVGVSGSTGTVLHRSLIRLHGLIDRALAAVRLARGIQKRERFQVSRFVNDLKSSAALEARARNVTFQVVNLAEDTVALEADRQMLSAAVGNLLQNAFKFTRPLTTVTMRVGASPQRVQIEVEDECGGLDEDSANETLFRPFEQRSADRSGLGLGLAFCRSAVEEAGGRVYARTLTGKGCIFTVDMPRASVPLDVATQLR